MEKEEARRWVRGIVWLSWVLWSGVVSKNYNSCGKSRWLTGRQNDYRKRVGYCRRYR